jgi:hypothetical protein
MSNLAANVLRQVIPCPLSTVEIAEDFDASQAEIEHALAELQNAGQVMRFDNPEREDGPFFGLPCSQLSAGISPIENLHAIRSYQSHYDNPFPD